jgi:chromosome partitioning protein
MARIYVFVNQKGGVGKTTTAISLGANLALQGQRVLLVDLDPQANATSSLGVDKNTITGGLYAALVGAAQASAEILNSARLRLALLPSSLALAGAEIELVGMLARESQLQRVLQPLEAHYDYILLDCPPSLGLLTLNGLVAARDGVIIPVQAEYLALEGLGLLTHTIGRVRQALNPQLDIRGVVITMFDGRVGLSGQVVAEVRKHFGAKVFHTIVPRSVRLAEAPSHGVPISAYAPSSPGGVAYRTLAIELLHGDGIAPAPIEPTGTRLGSPADAPSHPSPADEIPTSPADLSVEDAPPAPAQPDVDPAPAAASTSA